MNNQRPDCKKNDIIKDNCQSSSECWKEKYRGDSRKWLISDGYPVKLDTQVCSTMRESYLYPVKEERHFIGARRAILLKKLYDEAAAEIIRKRNEPPPIEEYDTEYVESYNNNLGFMPEKNPDPEKNKELYEKYPLTSNGLSFWNFQIEKKQRSNASFAGLSASVDPKNPFKRNSNFTRPLSEVLDDCHL